MANFNIRVYGICINSNNQVLVADEIVRGNYLTKFPGGGLEFGEGTRDCLKREFKEEMDLEVEVGDRYRPDVVAVDLASPHPALRFWGEAGQVGVEKIRTLSKRYPYIHFAIAKWETSLHPVVEIV